MPALVNIRVGSLRGTSGRGRDDLVAVLGEVVEEGGADVVDGLHDGAQLPRTQDDTARFFNSFGRQG